MSNHPHPWSITSGSDVDTVVTDDNGDVVTVGDMWDEVQHLRNAVVLGLPYPPDCRDHGVGYEGAHGLGCDCRLTERT